jgi:6-phosphogluconate dehydrogenase
MTNAAAEAEIGLIGLGVMGSNLALNIAEKGFPIAVWNRTGDKTIAFHANAGPLKSKIIPCLSEAEFIAAIRPPRPVIIMVKAGEAVDEQIAVLLKLLSKNDIIIDAGNANFRDTIRRFDELNDTGLTFIGMGVSGGEEGARHGPSIMVGGKKSSWTRVEPVLSAISAKYKGESCAAWLGENGAGHFVKTIHNGIEYADMEMISEIYGILRDGAGMTAPEIGAVFETWNKGKLNSYLIEISAAVLKARDPKTKKAMVDMIVDRAGQKGTGKWSVIEAQMMGVPATAIEAAVAARSLSSFKDERMAAEAAYGSLKTKFRAKPTDAFLRQLELALFADGSSVEGVFMESADGDDFEDLAGRVHHPLTVPRHHRLVLSQEGQAGEPSYCPAVHQNDAPRPRPLAQNGRTRRRSRHSAARALVSAWLFRQLPPGPRRSQPHSGPARFLRRARF